MPVPVTCGCTEVNHDRVYFSILLGYLLENHPEVLKQCISESNGVLDHLSSLIDEK